MDATHWLSDEAWETVAFWAQIIGWTLTFLGILTAIGGYWAKSNSASLKQQRASEQEILRKAQIETLQTKLSEADQKVADVQKWQAPRRLTDQQKNAVIAAIKPFAGQIVKLESVLGDSDGLAFAHDFLAVFREAKWRVEPDEASQSVFGPPHPSGIEVTLNKEDVDAHRILASAVGLLDALGAQGLITNTRHVFKVSQVPRGHIWFRIGTKPPFVSREVTK